MIAVQDFFASIGPLADQLGNLLTDPTSNLTAALLLYGIIGVAVIIVLLLVIMALAAANEEPEDEEEGPIPPPGRRPARQAEKIVRPAPRVPLTPRQRLLRAGIVLGVACAVWALTGWGTAADSVCRSCHTVTSHVSAADPKDPHAKVACVSCHESGDALGPTVTDLPSRLLHFTDAWTRSSSQSGYGRVTSSSCTVCHGGQMVAVTTDKVRGVRMSHKEVVAAGAACIDCHAERGGAALSSRNSGMSPCVPCHDSKTASADCATCHDKKASAAARVRAVEPAVQVPDVRCDGCHDTKKECDWCHGTPMPHSTAFMAVAHARAGAVDLYDNGGKTCGKCHTATRRPCQRCHTPILGRGHARNNLETHAKSSESRCNACHQQWEYKRGRDFCKDLCHTPAAVASSPR